MSKLLITDDQKVNIIDALDVHLKNAFTDGVEAPSTPNVLPPFNGFSSLPTAAQQPAVDSFRLVAAAFAQVLSSGGGGGPTTLTGDVTGSGTGTVATTLANVVSAGTATKITFNNKGLVIGSAVLVDSDIPALDWAKITTGKPTTLAGYGIVDSAPLSHVGSTGAAHGTATGSVDGFMSSADKTKLDALNSANYQPIDADLTAIAGLAGASGLLRKTALNTWALDTNTYLTGNQSITLSGDISGTGSTAITATLATVAGSPGTFPKVTFNGKGLVTSGAALDIADIPTLPWSKINTTPTTLAGYGIADAAPLSHVGATGAAHGVATTSVNGFMSAADKVILDNLAASSGGGTSSIVISQATSFPSPLTPAVDGTRDYIYKGTTHAPIYSHRDMFSTFRTVNVGASTSGTGAETPGTVTIAAVDTIANVAVSESPNYSSQSIAAGSTNVGTGYIFSVPASTADTVLKIYVSCQRSQLELVAKLSDGTVSTDLTPAGTNVITFFRYVWTVTFKAATAGQFLSVFIRCNSSAVVTTAGAMRFFTATLA